MKRTTKILLIVLSVAIIAGIIFFIVEYSRIEKKEKPDETGINADLQSNSEDDRIEEKYPTFFARIIESNSTYIIVEPFENEEIRKSSDKISISMGDNNDVLYEIGTNVKITYTGFVMETYPAKVDAIDIELKSTDNFEIIFNSKPGVVSSIFYTPIINKGEMKKYNYNVYAKDGTVDIVINGEKMSLRDALLNNKITMDEIIKKANKDFGDNAVFLKDGGTVEYHYDKYTIIKFHTIEGNRDVYIGPPQK